MVTINIFLIFYFILSLDIENIVPISNSNNSEEEKMPINIIITNQSLNMLKNIKGNIFIEIENKYHCSISKKVEVKI